MFLKHLINPKPSVILLFLFLCVMLVLFPALIFEVESLFFHSFLNSFIIILFAIIAPFFLGTGLNNIVYEKNIIRQDNLVVGFVFVLLSSFFINAVEAWISAFLLLFMFNFLVESYQKDLPFSEFYNASIILSLATFFYPNLIFLTLILIIAGINYSNFNWRILVTIFLGLITPQMFYFVFLFLKGMDWSFYRPITVSKVNFLMLEELHISKKTLAIIFLVIVIFSFFELFTWLYKKSIKSRRTFMTIIWFFIFAVIIAVYSGGEYFYFSFLPLSVIIGNYFVYTKNRYIADCLFFLLVISSFYYRHMITF